MKNQLSYDANECPLWRHFRLGDSFALTRIFNENYDSLFFYGKRLVKDDELVKDCVQNLFLKIWTSRERLMAVKDVRPYLLKSLRRVIADQVLSINRKKALHIEAPLEFQVTYSHEDFLIATQTSREQGEILARTLNNLPARQREAIFLRFYEDLDYSKIAEVMALNVQSVRNLIHQSLRSIKSQINLSTTLTVHVDPRMDSTPIGRFRH